MAQVKATLRWLARAWLVYAHLAGMGVISLGVGYAIVQALAGREAVVTGSDLRDEPKSVPYKGRLSYTFDLEVHEVCPAETVNTFSTVGAGPPAVVTMRRPAVLYQPKLYNDIRIDNPLPDTVTPGRWRIVSTRISHCPTREWTDMLFTFEFEVTP